MKIKKTYQGVLPDNKIVNAESTSQTDTYSCDYINEQVKEIYSTNEVKIGTWIDGKPLYRKIVQFTLPITTSGGKEEWGTPIEIASNVKEGYIAGGFIKHNNNSLPLMYYTGIFSDHTRFNVEITNNILYLNPVNSATTFSGKIGYAIVEYTKTTD